MRWPRSSRIDPTIAADGKTGRLALARVDSYTIAIDPGAWARPRGPTRHGDRESARPAWRRRGHSACVLSVGF
eukprot:4031621-Prymnesium_polylepis.1